MTRILFCRVKCIVPAAESKSSYYIFINKDYEDPTECHYPPLKPLTQNIMTGSQKTMFHQWKKKNYTHTQWACNAIDTKHIMLA